MSCAPLGCDLIHLPFNIDSGRQFLVRLPFLLVCKFAEVHALREEPLRRE